MNTLKAQSASHGAMLACGNDVLVRYQDPYWVALQTVVSADGRVRLHRVRCLGENKGVRVGEAWIGDHMARVTEVKFDVWREEEPEE